MLTASRGTRLPTEPSTTAPGPCPACLSTSSVSSTIHCPPTHRKTHYSLVSEENVAYGKELLMARGQHNFQSFFPCVQALGISPSRFDCDICPRSPPLPSHISQKQAGKHGSCPPLSLPQPVGRPLPSAALVAAHPALQMCLVPCRGTQRDPSQPVRRGMAEGLGTVQNNRVGRVFSPFLSPSLLIS